MLGVASLCNQVKLVADNVAKLAFNGSEIDFGTSDVFPLPVAFNVVPLAGSIIDTTWDGSSEEAKLRDESRKILGIPELVVTATCTRVGEMTGHSISITAWFDSPVDAKETIKSLQSAKGVEVVDLPNPVFAAGKDPSFVGRIRGHQSNPRQLSLFVSGDNLRKGAALNAVQIAELLI